LFVDRPAVVIADEDAAVITVKSERHAEATQHLAKQVEIAESGFRGEELRGQDFPGSIVLHAESGEPGAASFKPVVGTAVELHEFADPCRTEAALAMSRGSALSGRTDAMLAQQPAQAFAAE
jgi:hypothetical protein